MSAEHKPLLHDLYYHMVDGAPVLDPPEHSGDTED